MLLCVRFGYVTCCYVRFGCVVSVPLCSLTAVHNSREKGRNAQLILDTNNTTTFIRDPAPGGETKSFTFDHSYWSFDGCKEVNGYFEPDKSHKNGSKFADQVSACRGRSIVLTKPRGTWVLNCSAVIAGL